MVSVPLMFTIKLGNYEKNQVLQKYVKHCIDLTTLYGCQTMLTYVLMKILSQVIMALCMKR